MHSFLLKFVPVPNVGARYLSRSLLVAAVLTAAVSGQAQSSLIELVRNSGFIFQGTVKTLGASTPTVAKEANTAVVLVNQVLDVLPPVGETAGREVTVRLLSSEKLRAGDSATFFTSVYSAGLSLGLQEVGTMPPNSPNMQANIRDARKSIADQALVARLNTAELVIVGVAGVPKPTASALHPGDMDDPLWWSVPVKIESVLKGGIESSEVTVYFASNQSGRWKNAPQLTVGQRGIFLLQRLTPEEMEGSFLFVIDALDSLNMSELERVRLLLTPVIIVK